MRDSLLKVEDYEAAFLGQTCHYLMLCFGAAAAAAAAQSAEFGVFRRGDWHRFVLWGILMSVSNYNTSHTDLKKQKNKMSPRAEVTGRWGAAFCFWESGGKCWLFWMILTQHVSFLIWTMHFKRLQGNYRKRRRPLVSCMSRKRGLFKSGQEYKKSVWVVVILLALKIKCI